MWKIQFSSENAKTRIIRVAESRHVCPFICRIFHEFCRLSSERQETRSQGIIQMEYVKLPMKNDGCMHASSTHLLKTKNKHSRSCEIERIENRFYFICGCCFFRCVLFEYRQELSTFRTDWQQHVAVCLILIRR